MIKGSSKVSCLHGEKSVRVAQCVKRKATYKVGYIVRKLARKIEEYNGISIYLMRFDNTSHISKGTTHHPIGSVANRTTQSVYLFWNTDYANVSQIQYKLHMVRRMIDSKRNAFRQKHTEMGSVFRPPPTSSLKYTYRDDTIKLAMESPDTIKLFEQTHKHASVRIQIAQSIHFNDLLYVSETSETFNTYLGRYNDFWYAVLANLLSRDGDGIFKTLQKLLRAQLYSTLTLVQTCTYMEKTDYRSVFYDVYHSVYLTEHSSSDEVVYAAISEFLQSGRDDVWGRTHPTPDIYKRRKYNLENVGTYFIIQVVSHHFDYLETLRETGDNSMERWGYVIDHDGVKEIHYDESVRDFIEYSAIQLIERGLLMEDSWYGQGGTLVKRWAPTTTTCVMNVPKRFPPLMILI